MTPTLEANDALGAAQAERFRAEYIGEFKGQTDRPSLIYLGSPYNHPDKAVMQERYELNIEYAAQLLHQGHFVYSPVIHNHPIACYKDLGRDWKYWEKFDLTMLVRCDELYVLTLDGWLQSVGLKAEIAFAVRRGIPVTHIGPESELYRKDRK